MPKSSRSQGGRKHRLTAFAAGAAAAMAIGASAVAMECATPGDRDGISVRVLQTQLMVAALSCNQRAEYNRFVTRYRPQLARHSARLVRYFRRVHGRNYAPALNRYVTDLANRASSLSVTDRQGFCAASKAAFERLFDAPRSRANPVLTRVAMETGSFSDPQAGCDAFTKR